MGQQSWPQLLEAIASSDQHLVLETASGARVVVLAEAEVRRLQELAQQPCREVHTQALTAREGQVLQLIAEGCSGAHIARRLEVSVHTVTQHLASARRKYGVRSSAAAARAAQQAGHLHAPHPPAPHP
ncbi:response regulator transcription factor [Kineococcus sp. SYSU DK005]|uniref:response regulator transcription factor n=1 Tax=Kineococcus sp. SYSU DK005 TaxID=3383126 RepID=UPI003D7DE882